MSEKGKSLTQLGPREPLDTREAPSSLMWWDEQSLGPRKVRGFWGLSVGMQADPSLSQDLAVPFWSGQTLGKLAIMSQFPMSQGLALGEKTRTAFVPVLLGVASFPASSSSGLRGFQEGRKDLGPRVTLR